MYNVVYVCYTNITLYIAFCIIRCFITAVGLGKYYPRIRSTTVVATVLSDLFRSLSSVGGYSQVSSVFKVEPNQTQ
jgi:hypothetical protein